MATKNQLAWLEDQITNWVEDGLISDEQAKNIRSHYRNGEDNPINLANVLLGSLATLLVGSGIVLIFAYQWARLSDLAKGMLSVLPTFFGLAFFIYVYFNHRKKLVWRESASGFMMLMIAASMGLWGQTFGLMQEAQHFWLLWIILSLPLLFIMNSSMAALLFCLGLVAGIVQSNEHFPLYFGLLFIGYAAHFVWNLKVKSNANRLNVLAWVFAIVLTIVWSVIMQSVSSSMNFLGYTACLSLLYILGHSHLLNKSRQIYPWQLFAILTSFFLLIFLSFDSELSAINGVMFSEAAGASVLILILWFLTIAGWFFIVFRYLFRSGSAGLLDYFFAIFPILYFAHLQLHALDSPLVLTISGSIIGLMGGAVYLKKGIEDTSLFFINVGMLILLAIISIRFFNTDWSNFWKGIIFVLLGLVFLGLNVYLARKNRQTAD